MDSTNSSFYLLVSDSTAAGYSWKALIFVVVLACTLHLARPRSKGKLPPGPPGWPIIGNLLDLNDRSWHKFTEWKKTYGPIYYVNLAGQNAVVLGSHKVAADLLDRRASIYSDRGKNIVAGQLLTGGLVFAFSQHNDVWKRMRRGSHEALNNSVAKDYMHFQETETVLLMDQLMQKPADWHSHLCRASTSLVMSIIYGLPPLEDSKDPIIVRVNHFTERALAAAAPGAYLVEYFTWMQYLPRWMSPWRVYAEEWFARDSGLFENLFDDTKQKRLGGDETTSVAAKLLEDMKVNKKNLTDKEAAWLAATLYAAGAETTSGQLAWWVVAMILHPEAQKKAQEEIDRVVGRDRLPSFRDYEHLPYVRAMVKEVMRWRGVAPLGVPHRLCQDDYYEGHFLPKDTLCIVNVWHLNHDPDVYGPDADEFRPDRHLDKDGRLLPSIADTKEEGHVTYGFGRRICVGRHVSNNSMFIEIASMLWGFDFLPGKDENGIIQLPDHMDSHNEGLVVGPVSFPCTVSPRFPEVESVIQQSMETRGLHRMGEGKVY